MGSDTNSRSNVFCKRANISTGRTYYSNPRVKHRSVSVERLKLTDRHLYRLALDRFSLSRKLIKLLAFDLLSRIHRRDLFDLSDKLRQDFLQVANINRLR